VPVAPSSTTTIPFEYCEGLLWIQVRVPQSTRPLNFLFDTGAGLSVINNDTARTLGLKTGNRINVQGVHATLTGHWPARLAATVGGLVLPSEYLALDLSKLAHSCGRPLDGLLGADFIRGRVVEIDFAPRQLRFAEAVSPSKSDTVVPLKIGRDGLCVPVGVNAGKPQWMRLDTGCATALQWVTTDLKTSSQSDQPAIGLAELAIPQAETTVSLGGKRFDQVPTGIHRNVIFVGEAGLVGNGLLSRFKTVTIDARAGRLILSQPQSSN
jgi:hypothetical protein